MVQRNRFIIFGQIGLLVVLAAAGLFFYHTRAQATGNAGVLTSDARAALTQSVDSLRVPGLQVPTTWQMVAAQQASHPDQLPARGTVPTTASVVWCTRIAPPITTIATPRAPAITLDHFVIAQVNGRWVAYAVDGFMPSDAQRTYTALGCTNG